MLSRKTCLLLGAGASSHLGFPLGASLKQRILFELHGQKDKRTDELPEEFRGGKENLELFFEKLAFGNWSSPDAFLEHHREFIHTGKFLICRCLVSAEDAYGIAVNDGWYNKLVNAIRVDHPNSLKNNDLSIVTFNYDRSIEFRLHKYIENQFAVSASEAWDVLSEAIPIVHVHGTLGEYPKWSYGDKTSIWERSKEIKIISEVEEDTVEFRRASQLLNDADRVVVFGFGFADDNVRRLAYFSEQDLENRDVIVAAGNGRGEEHEKIRRKLFGRWGLQMNKHWYSIDANSIFDLHIDPFA